jgi:hypothetical protein
LDEDQSQSDEQEEEKLDEVEEEVDESDLEPAELLKRARSRLLEDLSAENGGLDKGTLAMPHSLDKYKEVRVLPLFIFSSFRKCNRLFTSFTKISLFLQIDLQQEWSHWDLYSSGTCCHHC